MSAALMRGRERVDPVELGPTVLEYYARSLERGLAARGRADPARFVDVRYDDFVADPLGSVQRVYGHFELDLSPAAAGAMHAHVRDNPQGKHGTHEYGLEEFGLTPEAVRVRLRAYIERYRLPAD